MALDFIRSPKTGVSTYDYLLKDLDGKVLTWESIKSFLAEKAKVDRPATAATRKAAVAAYLRVVVKDVRVRAAIAAGLRGIKTPRPDISVHAEEILDQEVIKKIIGVATPRQAVLIRFLSQTGVRISETLSIKITDCKEKGEFVYIRLVGKGMKERRVFIPVALFLEVRSVYLGKIYLFEAKHGGRMSRISAYRTIRAAAKRAGVVTHPHAFRHSFATRLVKAGHDLGAVSRYLGHSSPTITSKIYVHTEFCPEDLFGRNFE